MKNHTFKKKKYKKEIYIISVNFNYLYLAGAEMVVLISSSELLSSSIFS